MLSEKYWSASKRAVIWRCSLIRRQAHEMLYSRSMEKFELFYVYPVNAKMLTPTEAQDHVSLRLHIIAHTETVTSMSKAAK